MTIFLQCPICSQALTQYQTSRDLHCSNKHTFAFAAQDGEQGYWVFGRQKKVQSLSRAQMRARMFLLASGVVTPLVDAIAGQLNDYFAAAEQLNWLDYECGDGFYLKALTAAIHHPQLQRYGFDEAENALFAAAKAGHANWLGQSSSKRLPFADQQFDLLTVIDKPLKGKEYLRVLKTDGLAVLVLPGPRHLWQLREQIYPGLTEKPFAHNLPKALQVETISEITWQSAVSGEQALTLLEMTPYAWRANDKLKASIAGNDIAALELDYRLVIAKRAE